MTDLKLLARAGYTIGSGDEHDAIVAAVEEIERLRSLRCKTCRWWGKEYGGREGSPPTRHCESPRVVYEWADADRVTLKEGGAQYGDYESYRADFAPTATFGCSCWEPSDAEIERLKILAKSDTGIDGDVAYYRVRRSLYDHVMKDRDVLEASLLRGWALLLDLAAGIPCAKQVNQFIDAVAPRAFASRGVDYSDRAQRRERSVVVAQGILDRGDS